MSRDKLLQNPIPINRVAARVIKRAKPEDVWLPRVEAVEHIKHSTNALPTSPIHHQAPTEIRNVIGRRRGRFTVVGFGVQDGSRRSGNKNACWVVRCDCGNYEHRTRVLRWLSTECDDMCIECAHRKAKIKTDFSNPPAPPSRRGTADSYRKDPLEIIRSVVGYTKEKS